MKKSALVLVSAAGAIGAAGFCAAPAEAVVHTFNLVMRGFEEVPVLGDVDGIATGTRMIDDVANTAAWSWTFDNLDGVASSANFVGHHIHGPLAPAGTAAGIFKGFSTAATVTMLGEGTIIGSTSITNAQKTAILANPCQFYVNIHTSAFGGGAVRGQIDPLKGDINLDNVVDTADLGLMLGAFGATTGMPLYVPRADINADGVIDTADLGEQLGEFGDTCP